LKRYASIFPGVKQLSLLMAALSLFDPGHLSISNAATVSFPLELLMMGHDHRCFRTKYYSNRAATPFRTPGIGTTYITGASANTDNGSSRYKPNAYTSVSSTGDHGLAYADVAISQGRTYLPSNFLTFRLFETGWSKSACQPLKTSVGQCNFSPQPL
jgi:hypothetical protein